MFTLKFYKSSNTSGEYREISSSITCNRYDKQETVDGYVFITYPLGEETPIEFRISDNHKNDFSFEKAYIENSTGKTIDAVSHKSSLTKAVRL